MSAHPPKFGQGERVIVLEPSYKLPPNTEVGDTGTVLFTGPWMPNRPVEVKMDRTGRVTTFFEEDLAPEPDTP